MLVKCNFLENMSSPQIFVLSLDIEIFKDRALTVEHTHKYHSLKHIIKIKIVERRVEIRVLNHHSRKGGFPSYFFGLLLN